MYATGFPEAARARIDDDVRRAAAYRRSKETAKGRAGSQHHRARSAGRALISVLLWPVKH